VKNKTSALGLAVVVAAGLILWWGQGGGGTIGPPAQETSSQGGSAGVAVADLPPEARHTLDLIDAGGPFPYEQDGTEFGNFEGNLPVKARGYYREYTVDTPGSDDRGARRIVAGGGNFYYTDNHYSSFSRIRR
jgi:ribonuclease T1